MEDSKKKTDIFYLVLLILTLITLVVGITFTYFSLFAKDKEDDAKVNTGVLSINYIDGSEINTYALLPIEEPDINTEASFYKKNFSITSDGTLNQYINIYLDVTENEFTNNALGYTLYDSKNRKVGSGSLPTDGRITLATNVYLESGEEKKYTILIWLKENYENQNYEQGNTFRGEFYITATQVKYE